MKFKSSHLLAPVGENPIIYSNANPVIPKTVILRFLIECSEVIINPASVGAIVDENESRKSLLYQNVVEYQREYLERNFAVEKEFGSRFLSDLPDSYKSDASLIHEYKKFSLAFLRCFLLALQLRGERNGCLRRTTGNLTKENMLEFFEGCNALSEFLKVVARCLVLIFYISGNA